MRSETRTIAGCCLIAALGVAAGWFAARQGGGGAGEGEEHHESHGLSPQALKNLGVTVGEAKLSTFVREVKVQATVVAAPLNERGVVAPLGGIVTALHARPGQVARAGEPLVSIARSPIPRPQLALTADLLAPASENLHESVAKLRMAAAQLEIAEKELARVRAFTETGTVEGMPVLPRKTLIDLEYDQARAQQELLNARRELERHGLSPEEIDSLREGGGAPPGNRRLWKRALEQNALWGEIEEAILCALPEEARDHAWSIAAIGELSAAGLATDTLRQTLVATPHVAEHFVEVASLLLDGNTVEKVRILVEAGALEPIMTLRAPADAPDWDVARIDVQPGQRVEAGDVVATLDDARVMGLRVAPLGEELSAVVRAFEAGTELRARPLVAGTGPELRGIRIDRLETRAGEEARGALAYISCPNEAVAGHDGAARSWRLRVGLRYLVLVPAQSLDGRFVLPAAAVTARGPDKIVFLADGDTFRAQPVHVEYEDDEVAVIANDGAIFPGDPVALGGAFALGLALEERPAGADPHAGHNHG